MQRRAGDIQDEWLVVRCLQQDQQAWSLLVEKYTPRLRYFIRRLIDDDEQVNSILQEVWLATLKGLRSLSRQNRISPWLYRVAYHQAMTALRHQYRATETPFPESFDLPDATSPDDLRQERAEEVHSALSRLGVEDREVLTLFFLEDLSIQDVSAVLGIPEGTVKSRLHRARGRLRELLQRLED